MNKRMNEQDIEDFKKLLDILANQWHGVSLDTKEWVADKFTTYLDAEKILILLDTYIR